jgi:hypothetical protein
MTDFARFGSVALISAGVRTSWLNPPVDQHAHSDFSIASIAFVYELNQSIAGGLRCRVSPVSGG